MINRHFESDVQSQNENIGNEGGVYGERNARSGRKRP